MHLPSFRYPVDRPYWLEALFWAIVAPCSLPWWPGLVPAIADKVREPRVRAGNTRIAMVVSNELQISTLGRPLLFEAQGIRHEADRRCRNFSSSARKMLQPQTIAEAQSTIHETRNIDRAFQFAGGRRGR